MKQLFAIVAVVGIVIAFYIIISSCAYLEAAPPADTYYNEFIDFSKYPDDVLLLLRCSWRTVLWNADSVIKDSDFCIIGKKVITKTEKISIPDWPELKGIEGVVKVQKVIYGELNTKEIPFYYEEPWGDRFNMAALVLEPYGVGGPYDTLLPGFSWDNDVSEDDVMIIFGQKGKHPLIKELSQSHPSTTPPRNKYLINKLSGGEYQVIGEFFESNGFISPKAIKLIKEYETLPPEEFEKQAEKLLLSSNNQELLNYIFRRNMLDTSKLVEIVEALANRPLQTPERQFLAYGWALYLLYEFAESDEIYFNRRPPFSPKAFKKNKVNDAQRQVLINIATKKFTAITNVQEGIKYLRLIGMFIYDTFEFGTDERKSQRWQRNTRGEWKLWSDSPLPISSKLFEKVPALKDNIKNITDSLSQRFKNDPDYPEWQKWVNKIFPADMPQNQK